MAVRFPLLARAFVVLCSALVVAPLFLLPWAIHAKASMLGPDRSAAWVVGWFLVFTALGALLLGIHTLRKMRRHARLAAGTTRFDARELVTDFAGLARKVRGSVDGITCVVTDASIQVDLGASVPAFSEEALRFLAGRSDAGAEAARELVASGCRSVVFAPRGTLVNGRFTGDMTRVVRSAIALIRAQGALVARDAGRTCPFCKDEVKSVESDGIVRCKECGTAQHAECWRESGGCSIHGCSQTRDGRAKRGAILGAGLLLFTLVLSGCSSAPPEKARWLEVASVAKPTGAEPEKLGGGMEPETKSAAAGDVVCFATRTGIELRGSSDGRALAHIETTHEVYGLALSPDGSTVAASVGRSVVLVRGGAIAPLVSGHGQHIAFSPDGKRLLIGNEAVGELQTYEVASGRLLRRYKHDDPESVKSNHVVSLAFAPDGKRVAVSCWGGEVTVLDDDLEVQQRARASTVYALSFTSMRFTADGENLLLGSRGALLARMSVHAHEIVRCDVDNERGAGVAAILPFPWGGKVVALVSYRDGVLRLIDGSGDEVASVKFAGEGFATSLGFAGDGSVIATFGVDGFVRYRFDASKL